MEHSVLQTEHSVLQSEHSVLQSEHSVLQTENSVLQSEHSVLRSKHSVLQTEHSVLQSEYSVLQSEHSVLQSKGVPFSLCLYNTHHYRYSLSIHNSLFHISETYGLMMAALIQPKHVAVWICCNKVVCNDELYPYWPCASFTKT